MNTNNFHITKTNFFAACIIFTVSLIGCSKNGPLGSDCINGTWIENVQVELNAWSEALRSYSDDPTKENCEKQKQAGLAYISALENVKNCVPTLSLADFNDSIKEAEDEINETPCD